jgi:hypothetical protein
VAAILGEKDIRILCAATNSAFSNTWLIVDQDTVKIGAASTLNAFSLGYNV